jgi:hypothetical protein
VNLRSLPFLLLAVLVLGGLWYWSQQEDPDGPGDVQAQVTPLLGALPGPPDFLHTWNAEGTKEYRYGIGARGLWRLEHPVEDEADRARLEQLLTSLVSAKKEFVAFKKDITPKMMEETELDTPLGRIVVGSQGERVEIVLGGEDVFRGELPQSFALVDGDLFKLPSGLEIGVEHNLHEMRSTVLFHASQSGLRELVMGRQNESGELLEMKIQRRPGGSFEIVEPIEAPADDARMADVLRGLLSMRVRRFIPIAGTPQVVIQEKPYLTIRLQGNYGPESARIWRQAGSGYYALVEGREVLLVLDSESFERVVLASAKQLVDRSLWPFDPKEASKLTLSSYGEEEAPPLVLASRRPEPGFRLVQPREGWSDAAAVAGLFDALARIQVDSVLVGDEVAAAGEAVSKPRFVVQLALPQGQRGDPVELRFGQHQGKWYAQRLGEKYVVSVTELDDERILAPWWDYVERIAFRVDRQRQPNRVIVRDGGEGASVPERIYERGSERALDAR